MTNTGPCQIVDSDHWIYAAIVSNSLANISVSLSMAFISTVFPFWGIVILFRVEFYCWGVLGIQRDKRGLLSAQLSADFTVQ